MAPSKNPQTPKSPKNFYAAVWEHNQPMWYSRYDSNYRSGEYTYPMCAVYTFTTVAARDACVAAASEQHARTSIRANGATLRAYTARCGKPCPWPDNGKIYGVYAFPADGV